jgi:hypothetical protein
MSRLVTPGTLLRWHRRRIRGRRAYPRRGGRPPVDPPTVALIGQLARENLGWGYRRIQGELPGLGIGAGVPAVRRVRRRLRIPPAPQRGTPAWRQFLRTPAPAMLACGFFPAGGAVTLRHRSVFVVLEDRRPLRACPRRDRAPGRRLDHPAGPAPADGRGRARRPVRRPDPRPGPGRSPRRSTRCVPARRWRS